MLRGLMRCERGQTAAEYMGLLVVVAASALALALVPTVLARPA
jgi:Flp pilus assembly pilin Flp